MSIHFACRCGKKLKVRDGLAGKRVKCPQCGKLAMAPNPAAEEEDDEASPPSKPKKPGPPTWARAFVFLDFLALVGGASGACIFGFTASGGRLHQPDRVFEVPLSGDMTGYLVLSAILFIVGMLADVSVLNRSRAGFVLACVSLLLAIAAQGARGTLLFDGRNSLVGKNYSGDTGQLFLIVFLGISFLYDAFFIWAAFKVAWKKYL